MTLVRSIFLRREAGILVMIVIFCTAVGLYKPQFLTGQSLKIILLLTPLVMIGAFICFSCVGPIWQKTYIFFDNFKFEGIFSFDVEILRRRIKKK